MNQRAVIAEARAFLSWQDYQQALLRAIAPLTVEQLGQRVIAGRRTPGEIAEHIVFGRALHLSRTLVPHSRERADGQAVLASLAPYQRWEDDGDPPRTAAEIVQGLEATWRVIEDQLNLRHASPTEALSEEDAEVLRTIWGLMDHDLPHAGQLSLLLRAIGMPGVDI